MRAHRLRLPFIVAFAVASTASFSSTPSYAQQGDTSGRATSATTPSATTPGAATPGAPAAPQAHVDPPAEEASKSTNVFEKPGKTYYFIDGGKTVYSNSIGAGFDIRKDGFSIIPNITYTEFGTGGDVLFKEKNKPDTANNWSIVNSSLKGIYANVDLLASARLHENVDFEYGVGLGIGTLFGSLVNNWVYEKANGPYQANNGKHYAACVTENDDSSSIRACTKGAHSNASTAKVNNYEEPSWFNGGSKFSFFLNIAPQIGLRVKPVKEVVARLAVGFSLTGFFFGVSGYYGLEKVLDKKADKP